MKTINIELKFKHYLVKVYQENERIDYLTFNNLKDITIENIQEKYSLSHTAEIYKVFESDDFSCRKEIYLDTLNFEVKADVKFNKFKKLVNDLSYLADDLSDFYFGEFDEDLIDKKFIKKYKYTTNKERREKLNLLIKDYSEKFERWLDEFKKLKEME